MIQQHYVLNSLTQWCVHKAGCQVCFDDCIHDRESQRLLRGMQLMYQVLRKTPNTDHITESGFYYRLALPRLQSLYQRLSTNVLLWDYRTANDWLTLEDRSFLSSPDFVTAQTLVMGGIPIHQAPTLGIIEPHDTGPRARFLQFLYDYYGFTRVYQFYRTGVLRPIIDTLVQLKGYSFPRAFANPEFHRNVDILTISQCIAKTEILYDEELAIEVVLDTYFSDVPHLIRDDMQTQTCQYLGIIKTNATHIS